MDHRSWLRDQSRGNDGVPWKFWGVKLMKFKPTCEELLRLLTYDPETGILCWKNGSRAGTCRGGVERPRTSRRVMVNWTLYEETHVIWCMVTGSWPTLTMDHKDRDPSNNRWDNLRELTHQQQAMNKGTYRNNTSGTPGVWWRESHQKWRAYIRVGGKLIHLGHFKDFEKAVKARKFAEVQYFGSAMPVAA